MLLRSRLLSGVRHGFSTRQGGVSVGRYASLNLSGKWGDDPAHVGENRRRFAEAGGFQLERLFTVKQIHGATVATVTASSPPEALASQEADAIVTDVPGAAIAIGTADCVPILISDGRGRVAAVHAGWRGTIADVVGRTVEALGQLGARPSDLRAALGPCICVRCFEVGPEVAERFASLSESVDRSGSKPHVDLRAANRTLLERAGLRPDAIDASPPCTMCEAARFYSFRRDGGQIGQQLSFIVGGPT